MNPPSNGNGNGRIRVPLSLGTVSVVVALLVQAGGAVVWATNEHNARIELGHRFEQYMLQQNSRVDRLVEEAGALNREQNIYAKRLDDDQRTSHRRLDLAEERIRNMAGNNNQFNEALNNTNQKLNLIDTTLSNQIIISNRFDTRLDRVVQALDATYNLINEHLRKDHANSKVSPQPPLRLQGSENR